MIAIHAVRRRLPLGPEAVVDGDTVRVRDPAIEAWGALLSRLAVHSDGSIRLRLAGLDAPESDYPAGSIILRHQAPDHCAAAAEGLRQLLAGHTGTLDMLAYGADRYGRALAFLWPGTGGATHPAVPVEHSLNAKLLNSGLAFPDFHGDLPLPWIDGLAAEVRAARAAARGIWASGAGTPELPRLFRRRSDFCRLQGLAQLPPAFDAATALRFREYLEQRERQVMLRDSGHVLPFAECIEWAGGPLLVRGDVENFLYLSSIPKVKLT